MPTLLLSYLGVVSCMHDHHVYVSHCIGNDFCLVVYVDLHLGVIGGGGLGMLNSVRLAISLESHPDVCFLAGTSQNGPV